jgi:hypothetical protein
MMSTDKESGINVIALDYYDGATEGFILSFDSLGSCYFKLVAWHECHDQRLYLVTPIDEHIFIRMMELLSCCNEQVSTKTWLAKWIFKSSQDKEEAESLVMLCQEKLKRGAIMVMGEQIHSQFKKYFTIANDFIDILKSF